MLTAVCVECEGLTLCKQLSEGYDHIYCHVGFKAMLWKFLCNLIDMDLRMGALQAECCVLTSQLWNLLLNVEVVSTVVT